MRFARLGRILSIVVVLAVSHLVAACSDDGDAGSADSITVGFITKFPVDFYDTMVEAAREYDRTHDDVEVLFGQGKSGDDDTGQIEQINNMIAQKVKAIAITPTSPKVQGALDKAVKGGIKIVLVDNDIPGWTGKSSIVATNNLAGGRLAGKWLAERLPAGATVGFLQGRLGNPSLDDRIKGIREGLGDKVTVVAEPATDCDQTKGLNAAQDILTAHPNITAIYGACGPPILGAMQAISAAGKKQGEVVVVGFDASPDEIAAIAAGDQAASVAQFPAKMGSLGVETAVKAARGHNVEAVIDTGTEMVTKQNVAGFQ